MNTLGELFTKFCEDEDLWSTNLSITWMQLRDLKNGTWMPPPELLEKLRTQYEHTPRWAVFSAELNNLWPRRIRELCPHVRNNELALHADKTLCEYMTRNKIDILLELLAQMGSEHAAYTIAQATTQAQIKVNIIKSRRDRLAQ